MNKKKIINISPSSITPMIFDVFAFIATKVKQKKKVKVFRHRVVMIFIVSLFFPVIRFVIVSYIELTWGDLINALSKISLFELTATK